MEINEKIKQRRLKLALTLQEVGEYLNVSKATVQRYESGEIRNLKQETIEKLAKILKTTPGYLMGWEDDETSSDYVSRKESIDIIEKNIIPSEFTDAKEARDYISMHQIFASEGFNIKKMSDEDILAFANEMLRQIELISHKYKK